jgi:hypothetical protein
MRYVDLDSRAGVGDVIDPTPYLRRLPELIGDLPPGARAFAADPGHYDFGGKRCTKDLRLREVTLPGDAPPAGEGPYLVARFRHNCWKHNEDLVVRYAGVAGVRLDVPHVSPGDDLGTVILDEILPHDQGCSHEIALRPGILHVVCRDLAAAWVEADCPDGPPAR